MNLASFPSKPSLTCLGWLSFAATVRLHATPQSHPTTEGRQNPFAADPSNAGGKTGDNRWNARESPVGARTIGFQD